MENESIKASVEELLSRAKNGEELFLKSPHFNTAINLIARGADPISIIENICESLQKTQDQLRDFLEKHNPHP
jgi:hypothetical protein